MTKHLNVIKRSIIKALTYRSELLVWLVLDTVPLLVLMLVWISVYQHEAVIKGYSLNQVLFYYFAGMVINGVIASHFESWRVSEIREGKIDFFLIRPLSYLWEIFLRDVGGKVVYVGFLAPFYLLLFFVLQWAFQLTLPTPSFTQLVLVGGLIIVGYLMEFLVGLLIVLLGFWFEGAEGLEHFKWIVITLFSGSMVPIAMMPNWLQNITLLLPFKYMYAVPIGLLQGTLTLTWFDIGLVASFLVGFWLIIYGVWQRAVYTYASSGG